MVDGVDFGTKNFQKSLYFKDLKQRGMQKNSRLPSRASNLDERLGARCITDFENGFDFFQRV